MKSRTMRRFLILGMLCTATATAVAEAPFAISTDVPDYVVTMVEHQAFSTGQSSRSVMHHGNWTRVDAVEGVYKRTTYFSQTGPLQITGPGNGVDGGMYVSVQLRPRDIGWDTEPRNTGARETFLGESCTVWNAQRVNPSYSFSKLEKLSCLTDDGIELWYRFVGADGVMSSTEATSIERRPVALGEVQPPSNLLALRWWDNDEPKASSAGPDFEVVLDVRDAMRDAGDADTQIIQTIRHHYPWTYAEVRAGGTLRSLTISHALGLPRLSFLGPGPTAESILSIWQPPSGEQPAPQITPEDENRSETILGEQCRWFDLMPGAADARSAECRTNDGIPLKQSEGGRMGETISTAVSLRRRPLALDEVKPPKDILSLDWWTKDVH